MIQISFCEALMTTGSYQMRVHRNLRLQQYITSATEYEQKLTPLKILEWSSNPHQMELKNINITPVTAADKPNVTAITITHLQKMVKRRLD
jgi:hypothetical protein